LGLEDENEGSLRSQTSLQFTRPAQFSEFRGFKCNSRYLRNDLYDPLKWSNCNSAGDVLTLQMSHPMNAVTSVTIVDGDGIIEAEVWLYLSQWTV